MRILTVILILSIIANLIGLAVVYKYLKSRRHLVRVTQSLMQSRAEYNKRFQKQLLFIHHSVGENWLKEGGLKDSLESLGIGVHGATYGSVIGQNTDMVDWLPKFSGQFERILKYDSPPEILYPDRRENDIIMFKPCFPNSDIVAEGTPPGNPSDVVRTVWNYKAIFAELGGRFSKSPDKLFIFVTAPPLVPSETTPENAGRAREFNNWVKNEYAGEYRKNAGLSNFHVFDLFDVLADSANCLDARFRRSDDNSHPNDAGSLEATDHFLRFLRENDFISE